MTPTPTLGGPTCLDQHASPLRYCRRVPVQRETGKRTQRPAVLEGSEICCNTCLSWFASVVFFGLLCRCRSLSATRRIPGSYPCHLRSQDFVPLGRSFESLYAALFVGSREARSRLVLSLRERHRNECVTSTSEMLV